MILIGCRGNDPEAPRLMKSEQWEYGIRSDHKAYASPYFVDINWGDYCWRDHLAVVAEHSPQIAMVADYESPAQKPLMLAQIADIERLGVRAMVCPKFLGVTGDIPKGCLVGLSVPTDYAGFLPPSKPVNELAGREVHMLGGHPDQYVVLMRRYAGAHFVSADCSAIFQKAQFGAFWSSKKNTWRYVKHRFHTHSLTRMSARNVKRYLDDPPTWFVKQRQRLGRVGFQLQSAFEGWNDP